MKLKNVEFDSDDFWYDLFDGGYIKPEEIIEDQSDIDNVIDAISVLSEFRSKYEHQINK